MHWRTWRKTLVALPCLLFLALAGPLEAQQTGRVTGRVINATTNRPLAGVQVFVPQTGIGNLTDADGRYLLQGVPAGAVTVTAQLVGYKQAEVAVQVVAGQVVTANLSLAETAIALEEIVITGAGVATQRKKLGNTIASIDAEKVKTAAVSDVSMLLAAREPGVSVLPSGGYSGQGARIRIRGSSSLSQLNEPVIYVDGIRMDGSSTSFNTQGNPSKLDDIPPEAIERIEILKGAAAATLYGTEASNGVIQIFTKKGRAGAPRFTLQVDQTAISMPLDRVEPLADFARSQEDIQRIQQRWGLNVGLYEPFSVDLLPTYFNTGYHQAYSLSVTGGGDRVNYFVTGRFQDENGPSDFSNLFEERPGLKASDDKFRRAQMTANVVVTPVEKVRIGVNTMYSELNADSPENGNNIYGVWPNLTQTHLRLACAEVSPICPKVNLYGSGAFITANEAIYSLNEVESNHFTGSVNVNYSPIQAVKLDGTFGVDFINESSTWFRPFGWNVDNYVTATIEGLRNIGEVRTRVLTADFKASWESRFGELSNRLLAGTQGFLSQRTSRGGTGIRFPGPGLEVAGAGADQSISESWNRNTQVGGYLDNQIGFRDWAFVTVGARWDANSAFGEAFNTAFYPKINASVVPTEAFGWQSDFLSTLRVRAALGKSGLQPSSFAKFTTYSPQPSAEGPGIRPSNLGNEALKAEVATETEFGAEFGLFNDRASLEMTYWKTDVVDAIVARQFPVSGGFINTQLDNIGKLEKSGFDIAARGTVIQGENLSISVFANGAFLKQEIADLGGAPPLKTGGSYSRYRQYLVEGFAPGSFFGAKVADLDIPLQLGIRNADGSCREPTRAEALAYFAQARDPGSFKPLVVGNSTFGQPNGLAGVAPTCGTSPLSTYLGKSTPDWQGTFGFTVGFLRDWELTSLLEYKAGDYVSHDLSGEFRRTHAGIGRNTPNCVGLEAVMRNPASTADARLESAINWARQCEGLAPLDGLNSINPSDFVRWRELSLTYRVPTSFVDRFGLASAQLSLAARNLALWVNDAFTGMDPEAVTNGRCNGGLDCNFLDATDLWQVPVPKRYTFSARVSF